MRCPTCGEALESDASRCPTCGAVVAVSISPPVGVRRCPRCGYHGQGVAYFSRPGHVGLLVGVSLFTYGLGGLIYWLVRRRHNICPNCGLGWDHAAELLLSGERAAVAEPVPLGDREEALPSGGSKRRVLGTLLTLLATILVVFGIVEFEAELLWGGSFTGAAGMGSLFWGWKASQKRRQAIMGGLQRKVLRLATHRGGTLTVTEVAADLDLSITAAEKVLIGMDDGFRVRSEITEDGILLYEFPEVQHRSRLGPGADVS